MHLTVFSYNFPHKKTQDFLLHLAAKKILPDLVIAADPIKLNLPAKKYKYKINHSYILHPKDICTSLNINYIVLPHGAAESKDILQSLSPEIGLIAGARIIPDSIINLFKTGIINFHPGLIPESRGLDAMLWSVFRGTPLGVTAHFIDKRVDAGWVIAKEMIKVDMDDTWFDISTKLYDLELHMLNKIAEKKFDVKKETCEFIEGGYYNPPFTSDLEDELNRKFDLYKKERCNSGDKR